MSFQEPCLRHQADEPLSHVLVACERGGTYSLKTLKKTKADLVLKGDISFRCSKEGRPNILPRCREKSGEYIFTEKMLALAPKFFYWTRAPFEEQAVLLLYAVQGEHIHEVTRTI